jgi:hypothetical protein
VTVSHMCQTTFRINKKEYPMQIEFIVEGRPPKKHGEKSMWALDDEAPLIDLLRRKAYEARLRAGLRECFRCLVGLEITVFVPESRLETVGDLDNFIAGICDSLQAADANIPSLHPIFHELAEDNELHPRHPILIDNDAKVVSITGKKVAIDERQTIHYKVVVKAVQAELLPNNR